MKPYQKAIFGVGLLLLLFWLWPNLVHEPLHVAAMKLQGGQAVTTYDFSFPAHPTTTRLTDVTVAGGLLFLLLPSLVSIVILLALMFTSYESIFTHITLPVYVATDLFINIRGYNNAISDFRFLAMIPHIITLMLALSVLVFGLIIASKGIRIELNKDKDEINKQSWS